MARWRTSSSTSAAGAAVDDYVSPGEVSLDAADRICTSRHGTPAEYGWPKTLCNRWKRWSGMGVFARTIAGLAAEADVTRTVMIDGTFLKAHRTASSLQARKGGLGRLTGRTKGGLNTKLHGVADAEGRPIRFFCWPDK